MIIDKKYKSDVVLLKPFYTLEIEKELLIQLKLTHDEMEKSIYSALVRTEIE